MMAGFSVIVPKRFEEESGSGDDLATNMRVWTYRILYRVESRHCTAPAGGTGAHRFPAGAYAANPTAGAK